MESAPPLTRIGKYEIVEKIGVGGFGTIYKGRDPFIKRDVAIKTCNTDDDEIKRRFFIEAEIAGNLRHPFICTIHDLGVQDGVPYIVLEYLAGEDLDRKIRRREEIPIDTKIGYMMGVCEAMAYAHAEGIVHRDLKPGNIRVLPDGTPKVLDFGIAKSMKDSLNLTQSGVTWGTAAYLSPEQINGETIDAQTDIFALGVVMYELLAYVKPFVAERVPVVLYKILNDEPERLVELVPGLPLALETVVWRAMRKSRAERYKGAIEMVTALSEVRDLLRGMPSREPRGGSGTSIALGAGDSPATAALWDHPAAEPSDQLDIASEALEEPDFESRIFGELTSPMVRSLADRSAPGVIRDLHEKHVSGYLQLESGEQQRVIYFLDGEIKSAISSSNRHRLGQRLLDRRAIDPESLKRAVARQAPGKRIGTLLVEEGVLRPRDLERHVTELVREIVIGVFDWVEGRYLFVPSTAPVAVDLQLQIFTPELLLEGCRRITDERVLDRAFPRPTQVLQVSESPPLTGQQAALTSSESFAMSRIDGVTPVGSLVKLIPLPPLEVKRSIYALLASGMLREKSLRQGGRRDDTTSGAHQHRPEPAAPTGPAPSATADETRAGASVKPAAAPAPRPAATPAPKQAPAPAAAKETKAAKAAGSGEDPESPETLRQRRQHIETVWRKLDQLDHYELLEVPRRGTQKEIRMSYAQLLDLYHPELHSKPGYADLEVKLRSIRSRIEEAYETLLDPERRQVYDRRRI